MVFAATANLNSMSKVAENRVALSGQIRKQIAKYARIDSSIYASLRWLSGTNSSALAGYICTLPLCASLSTA